MREKPIRCDECGAEMKMTSVYQWHDKFLGDLEVQAFSGEYHFCKECENERIAYSLMKRIEKAEQAKTEQLLLQSVNCNMNVFKENLVPNKDLVRLLGKSRQAIQQDGRIKTLIFHFEFNGQIYWWRDSVLRFKRTKDGRYDLTASVSVHTVDRPIVEIQRVETIEFSPKTFSSPPMSTVKCKSKEILESPSWLQNENNFILFQDGSYFQNNATNRSYANGN